VKQTKQLHPIVIITWKGGIEVITNYMMEDLARKILQAYQICATEIVVKFSVLGAVQFIDPPRRHLPLSFFSAQTAATILQLVFQQRENTTPTTSYNTTRCNSNIIITSCGILIILATRKLRF